MELLIPLLLLALSFVALLLWRHRRRLTPAGFPSAESLPPSRAEEKVKEVDGEKKRKKKGRRRRSEGATTAERGSGGEKEEGVAKAKEVAVEAVLVAAKLADHDGMYPFSSLSSATQRRIKHRYDELVRSNESKALTVAQVGQFITCLVEARNDLQQKSQIIQRKFTIAKALLLKADRPSFCRLCQQINKLETEQKRLEEDAVVYNRIQRQLKLSPAFKTMLDVGARMEAEADSGRRADAADSDFTDISFEELLAKEKKDSFWKRNGKLRSCTR